VARGEVPGAVAAVGRAEGTLRRAHFGSAELAPQSRPMPEDALFDLASLTKIVATTTLALRLLERGALSLDQRVAAVLPAFGAAGKEQITIRHLLSHTSGMAPPASSGWRERWEAGEGAPPIWDLICQAPLRHPPGSEVLYSDSGFFTLGVLLAEIGGAPLDTLARREVFDPLGLRETCFCPPQAIRARTVATETKPRRGGTIVGTVHDEMAAAVGGVAGHAGLFSTSHDLERYCRMWLGGGRLHGERDGVPFLSGATAGAATRDQTGGAPDGEGRPARRGLGWVLLPNPRWAGGELCSPSAFGHTGFTGTSLFVDPAEGIFAVLLTNRVHPTRDGGSLERVESLRARFHNAVSAALSQR
jgi:serine-type D-Ala-D-Ala carboxypeptidase